MLASNSVWLRHNTSRHWADFPPLLFAPPHPSRSLISSSALDKRDHIVCLECWEQPTVAWSQHGTTPDKQISASYQVDSPPPSPTCFFVKGFVPFTAHRAVALYRNNLRSLHVRCLASICPSSILALWRTIGRNEAMNDCERETSVWTGFELTVCISQCLFTRRTIKLWLHSPDVILCGWLGLKHQLTN